MSVKKVNYVVYAPSFNADSGGTIFLHELVHALNELGETAYLWPMAPIFKQGTRKRIKEWLTPPEFRQDPALNTPVARKSDLNDQTIVVYPEIVRGNPLRVQNVVRWLLYKPGEMHPYEFTEGEMFFRVFEKADMPELTGGAPDLFLWKVNRCYRDENRPDRKGICYTVRKGHLKSRIPETETTDAIDIDGMTHAEINDVFNRCEVFYSYDEATMYSQFAAICGCLSIIIPGEHASHAEWAQNHDLGRFGVAYGTEPSEIEHAYATRNQLLDFLDKKERAALKSVKQFVMLTKERFGG